jgi:hypothetical protein
MAIARLLMSAMDAWMLAAGGRAVQLKMKTTAAGIAPGQDEENE